MHAEPLSHTAQKNITGVTKAGVTIAALQLKLQLQPVGLLGPSDRPRLPAASSVSPLPNCFAGSQQRHSAPPPFSLLSLANVTQTTYYFVHLRRSRKAERQPIHDLIRKMAPAVCYLMGPEPQLCGGSLPPNLFEVIVPGGGSLCGGPSSQPVVTVRNYL